MQICCTESIILILNLGNYEHPELLHISLFSLGRVKIKRVCWNLNWLILPLNTLCKSQDKFQLWMRMRVQTTTSDMHWQQFRVGPFSKSQTLGAGGRANLRACLSNILRLWIIEPSTGFVPPIGNPSHLVGTRDTEEEDESQLQRLTWEIQPMNT